MKKLLSAFSAALLAGAAYGAEYELIAPLVTSESSYNYQAMDAFKNYVETQSGGKISVKIYPSATLCGSAEECFNMLSMGHADIFQSNFGDPSNIMPAFAVLDLPYMLRDNEVAECTFDDAEFMGKLRNGFLAASRNMRLMVVSNSGGWRNIATTKKPVLTPQDVKGLKLRTIPAEVQQELVRQLGGAPTGISWSEVYTSLASGLVEGTKNGITDIVAMDFHDHLKNITLDGHAYMGGTWFMNNDKFMSMPYELRVVVVEGFDVLNQYLRAYPKYHEVAAYKAFMDKGGKIHALSKAQKQAFKEATKGMEDWFTKQSSENGEWLAAYKDTIKACETKVDARLKALAE